MSSHLLLPEPPLVVLPTLAVRLGLNEAILLQQIHFLLQNPKNGRLIDGERWIYKTVEEWLEDLPFFSRRTLERILARLESSGALRSIQPNAAKWDRTKHYRVAEDAAILAEPSRQNGGLDTAILAGSKDTETTTETTYREKEKSLVQDEPAPLSLELVPEVKQDAPPTPSAAELIRIEMFPYYCEQMERNPALYTLTPARLQKGVARLKECVAKSNGSIDRGRELFWRAIEGLRDSDFHQGQNDRKTKYNDWIDHLCKSPEQFEKWIEKGLAVSV